jgi:hypothetical protein
MLSNATYPSTNLENSKASLISLTQHSKRKICRCFETNNLSIIYLMPLSITNLLKNSI